MKDKSRLDMPTTQTSLRHVNGKDIKNVLLVDEDEKSFYVREARGGEVSILTMSKRSYSK